MRVVISGTHGSGKSTLIGDFAMSHREWSVLPDPFEYLDSADATPGAEVFHQQLRIAAARLLEPAGGSVIAERGPLDFLAYLHAIEALGRPGTSRDLFERSILLAAHAMAEVDLLVLLPLTDADGIRMSADEDLELRAVMDLSLLELADDPDLVGGARVVEIAGTRAHRLTMLEAAISDTRFRTGM